MIYELEDWHQTEIESTESTLCSNWLESRIVQSYFYLRFESHMFIAYTHTYMQSCWLQCKPLHWVIGWPPRHLHAMWAHLFPMPIVRLLPSPSHNKQLNREMCSIILYSACHRNCAPDCIAEHNNTRISIIEYHKNTQIVCSVPRTTKCKKEITYAYKQRHYTGVECRLDGAHCESLTHNQSCGVRKAEKKKTHSIRFDFGLSGHSTHGNYRYQRRLTTNNNKSTRPGETERERWRNLFRCSWHSSNVARRAI